MYSVMLNVLSSEIQCFKADDKNSKRKRESIIKGTVSLIQLDILYTALEVLLLPIVSAPVLYGRMPMYCDL